MNATLNANMSIAAMLEQTLTDQFAPEKVLYRLLLSKLSAAGLRLNLDEKKKLLTATEESFRTGDWSSLKELPIERRRRKNISIDLAAMDVDHAVQGQIKTVEDLVPKMLKKVAQATYLGYQRNAEEGRVEHNRQVDRFKSRLARSYGAAFRSFGRFQIASINTGQSFLSDLATKGGLRQTAKRIALLRLHHRACCVSVEIESLLQSGLGDGAMARWRTLHELCVIAVFISQNSNDVARRYLRHEQVDRAKIERLFTRLAGEELGQIDEITTSLRATYGKGFTEDCGWASKALKIERVKFSDLEKATDFGHARLDYLKANNAVHASSLALHYRPSLDLLTEPGDPMEWAIGSNLGLSGPAVLCAWSLLNVTIALLNTNPTADNVVLMMILSKARHEVVANFVRADQRIKNRHRDLELADRQTRD